MGITEPLSDIDPKPIEWIWKSRIPRGIMTVVEGDGGVGKSSLSLEIASALSVGRRLPENDFDIPPCHTLILTTEDDPRQTAIVTERVRAMGGNPKLIHFFRAPDEIDLARDIAAIEQQIVELQDATGIPVGLLIIDPLTDYLQGGAGQEQSVKRSLDPIKRVVAKFGLGWIAIRHLTKQKASASAAGLGSVKIRNMARSQLLLAEHPDSKGVVVVASSKRNWCATPRSLAFRCAGNRVEWLGECPYGADQLLRPDGYNKAKVRARARDFLEAELSMGAVPIKVVFEHAKDIHVSRPTPDRACDDLGVDHFREGFPVNTFWWFLPG